MPDSHYLPDVLILLAAVAIVPVFRRFRANAVLGYLVAGALIGPHGLDLLRDIGATEFWASSASCSSCSPSGSSCRSSASPPSGAMSSGWGRPSSRSPGWCSGRPSGPSACRAVAPWCLAGARALVYCRGPPDADSAPRDRKPTRADRGRGAAAPGPGRASAAHPGPAPRPAGIGHSVGARVAFLKAAVAFLIIFAAGRLALRPLLRAVARGGDPELFTGIALLLVLGVGWLTQRAGLSMALGAFLAGLLIAETEYRPQMEGDIRPFRGLLLALFFMTVGMKIDLGLLAERGPLLAGLLVVLLLTKAGILTLVSRGFGLACRRPPPSVSCWRREASSASCCSRWLGSARLSLRRPSSSRCSSWASAWR